MFRVVCQISGQDNVSCNPKIILAKGNCRNICFNEGFVCNCNFNNCAALLSENLTHSLKLDQIRSNLMFETKKTQTNIDI